MPNIIVNRRLAGGKRIFGQPIDEEFSPETLGNLVAWYEASDANNFILDSSTVDQWNDLSGNSRHLVATLTARPVRETVADFGGLNAVKFDGSNDILEYSSVNTNVSQPYTYCMMLRTGSSIGELETQFDGGIASASVTTLKWSGVSNNPHGFAGSAVQRLGSNLSVSTSYIDVTQFNDTSSFTRWNGTAFSFSPGSGGASIIQLGGTGRGGFGRLSGHIAEFAYFDKALSQTEYEQMEGYLAHKWGRSADLPVDHPYKSSPP